MITEQRKREFSDLVLAACRFFDVRESTAHKVIVACLESAEAEKPLSQTEIDNLLLKEKRKVARVARRTSTTPKGA